jgi:hypothetical protein
MDRIDIKIKLNQILKKISKTNRIFAQKFIKIIYIFYFFKIIFDISILKLYKNIKKLI